MKKMTFYVIIMSIVWISSCISCNLAKNEETNPDPLIGEWDAVKFAYSEDGHNFSEEVEVSKNSATILIKLTTLDRDGPNLRVELQVVNSIMYDCSIENNIIELIFKGSTYINVVSPHLEYDFIYALENASSFVINGNELIIYFSEIEDKELLSHCTVIKNKNLLILNKR